MNERIEKLSEQAREFVRKQMLLFQEADMSQRDAKWAELYNTKFAELIVRECLSVVGRNIRGPHGEYDYSYSDADAAADSRAQGIHDDIKYHFGIE